MQTNLLLEMAADAAPDRGAFGRLDYATTLAQAKGGAALISALPGQHCLFLGVNDPAFPLALFASGLAGKPFVPLNYRLADQDLRRLVERTAPAVAIVDADMAARIDGIAGVTVVPREVFIAACHERTGADLPLHEQEVAVQLFTSGTTGDPKAALLRHANLTSYVLGSVEFMGAAEGETALVSVPPYHIAGISAVLSNCFAGRRIVYLPAFTAEEWVALAAREQVTHAMVVPTMLGRILDVLDERGETLPALKALSYGGGRMPLPVIERALALLPHVDFVNAYGLTETSSTISVLSPDDHRLAVSSEDPAIRRRLGSVGRPLPTLEIEIRSPAGRILPHGESGEVHVRGDQVAGEYLGRRLTDADGWFATNDGGWIDEAGYLYLEGRLDDVIVRGGENMSPGEIEDVLRRDDRIADVAVLGLPDDRWGERVAAVIVPRGPPPAVPELAEMVRAALRSTKVPETWLFRDALPYNDTGKLLRRVLRQDLVAGAAG